MRWELTMPILYDGLPKILGALLYDCLHTPLGADEVKWILVVAAHHCYIQWWRLIGWHYVSDSHKVVMAAIIFMLPSNSCCSVSLQFHRYSLLALCCSIIHMLLVVYLDTFRLSTLLIQPIKSYVDNGIIVRYDSSVSRWHKMHTVDLIIPWLEDVFRGYKSLCLCLLHYSLGLLSIATVVCGR